MTLYTKSIRLYTLGVLLMHSMLFAQQVEKNEIAIKYAQTITIEDLRDNLNILASDALEGRETGKRGQKMAAAFISSDFEANGLLAPVDKETTSSYLQTFKLFATTPPEGYIKINEETYMVNTDFFYSGNPIKMDEVELKLVFLGAGEKDDFLKQNVRGKSVFVLNKDMQKMRDILRFADSLGVKTIFTPMATTESEFQNTAARVKGFFDKTQLSISHPDDVKKPAISSVYVSPKMTELLMGKSISDLQKWIDDKKNYKRLTPTSFKYKINLEVKTVESENVLGMIEGTDLKNEIIVISCHYDHIGITNGEINNGADDDASGTSAIMEMSEAFAQAVEDGNGPRRTLLFIAFTGEEKGLLGSEHYADNPIVPLENTIVDLNIDMIGRKDDPHPNNDNYVYLVGSDKLSSQLHNISEAVNSAYFNLDLDYTYNDENHPDRIYYRSDHWNFAKNNIPVIFYTNGFHPEYHKPTDTVDKIEFELLKKRTQLVFYTAWELANRNDRPLVDKKN